MTRRPTRLIFLFTLLFAVVGSAQELRRGSAGSGDDPWHPPNPPAKRNHPASRRATPSIAKTRPKSNGRNDPVTVIEIPTNRTDNASTTTPTAESDDRVDSAIERGNAALDAGRGENAEEFYKMAAQLDPNDWRAYMGLGNLYWDYGRRSENRQTENRFSMLGIRYDDAVAAYQKAAQLKPDEPAIFVSLSFIFNDGFSNREGEAIAAAQQALRLDPSFPEAHLNLGTSYLNTNRFNEAIVSFKEAIRLKPQYGRAYRLLGITYGQLKRQDEEIETYKLGIRTVPDYVKTYYSLASTYEELKRHDEGIAVLRQLSRQRPTDHEPLEEIGRELVKLGRFAEAVAPLKEAMRLNYHPKVDKYPHTLLAEAYISLKQYDDAIAVLKDIIRIGPNLSPSDDYERMAFAYNQSERYAEAVEAAQQSIKMHSDSPSAFNSLAYGLNQLGRYEEAVTAAKRSIALSPGFGNPHSHIAYAYLKTGRIQDALGEAQQATKLAPRYARAHYTLGLVYLALKNKAQALEAQKTLLGLDPKLAEKLLAEINR